MQTELSRGTAEIQGDLWGTDARAWAAQEDRQLPIYTEIAKRLALGHEHDVLEVGCASGAFLRLAADRGARVSGLDASEALIALARGRVPEADLRVGDLQSLPYEAATFDVVAGFNAFQFADDPVLALREAARVTKPGGRVVMQVWGRAERCELGAVLGAMAPFLPGELPGPPGGGAYSDPGVLERLASEAGLTPEATGDVVCAFEYADEAEMLRTLLAAGMAVLASRTSGDAPVRAAIRGAIVPFRDEGGAYRVENEWHYLVARR
jgi:SAM-dependent methyltransferase